MHRSVSLVLVSLALLLVLLTLAVGKPGLPMTLKADEPAYYLAALSLAQDLDLRCEVEDLGRLFDEYPFLSTFNLILMTDDGWNTVYFGKPYVYSLFAAPFAGIFGANGLVAFNMLLMMAMVWMGTVYLARFNTWGLAALYSCGFFLVGSSFAYVFWLHPEVFNMACIAASLFLILHRFDDLPSTVRRGRVQRLLVGPTMRAAASGAVLSLAVYNKPMLVALALPSLFVLARDRRWRQLGAWVVAAVVVLILVSGLSVLLTGHPSAYLGVERMGVPVFDPQQMPIQPVAPRPAAAAPTTNSWFWLLRIPEVDGAQLLTDLKLFLVGRHTGLLPYMPFAVISMLLLLLRARSAGAVRWLTLAAIGSVGLFFLIWIPFNWHGGGGFVGNRYFVNVYPAFLFLVTQIRPAWMTAVAYALGGIFIGPILFTPFGAPVPEPTLQAHVRNPPFRYLPLELRFRTKLPGYEGMVMSGAWLFGRKEVLDPKSDELWIHGATPVEIWMMTPRPLEEPAVFMLRSWAPRNEIRFDFAGTRVDWAPDPAARDVAVERFAIEPTATPKVVADDGRPVYAYRMQIATTTGFIPNAATNAERKMPFNDFYVGVSLAYLGSQSDLERDLFSASWGPCETPESASASSEFAIVTRVRNTSSEIWPARGPTRVNLAYRWLTPSGDAVIPDGRRTSLPRDVAGGESIEIEQTIAAPDEPGSYLLELDLVRERVSWFSSRRPGEPCREPVEILPPDPTADIPVL